MGLKPVTEAGPQHALRGPRASTLQNVVLYAVEEWLRYSRGSTQCPKARERREFGGSPLPAIADHSRYTKCAHARVIVIHRRRIHAPHRYWLNFRLRLIATPLPSAAFYLPSAHTHSPLRDDMTGQSSGRGNSSNVERCETTHIPAEAETRMGDFIHGCARPSRQRSRARCCCNLRRPRISNTRRS